ncbi:hypothetical protein [Marinicellulosiphila megalodicopiae]|uniref:hypothetical protein n=1 Tax=Marinicellulosiphila megalodicopiae TaxID=2724896 RepID=UPI003BB12252
MNINTSMSYESTQLNNKKIPPDINAFDGSVFEDIDKLTSTKEGVSSNISSKAQFLFNLQSHAHTLNSSERENFANAMEDVGSELFERDFIDVIRTPSASSQLNLSGLAVSIEAQKGIDFGIVENDEKVEVLMTGKITPYHQSAKSAGYDIPLRGNLIDDLEQLSTQTESELSKQDSLTLKVAFEGAISGATNQQADWYSILDTHHKFEKASMAIDGLEISEELGTKYTSLLAEIKSATYAISQQRIDESEQNLLTGVQFKEEGKEGIEMMKQGIELSKQYGEYLSKNGGLLEGSEHKYKSLLRESSFIESPSSDMLTGTMDWLKEDDQIFQEVSIDQGWTKNTNKIINNEARNFNYEQSTIASNQFINAINSYIQVSKEV